MSKQKFDGNISRLLKLSPRKIPKSSQVQEPGTVQLPPTNWGLIGIYLAAITVLVAICYTYSLWGQIVFNDPTTLRFVAMNEDWNSFWAELWRQGFQIPFSQAWLKATFAWDFQNSGTNPMWFHIVNVSLHLLSCLYLFFLVFRVAHVLKKDDRLDVDPYLMALIPSLLFACHPLTTEGVAYISGRVAPILAATYFLALNCFVSGFLTKSKTSRFWAYASTIMLMAMGLWISPDALTMPATMLLLGAILKPKREDWGPWARHHAYTIGGLIILLLALPFLLINGIPLQISNGAGLPTPDFLSYIASQTKGIVFYYVRCTILPLGLSIDPPAATAKDFGDFLSLLGALILVAGLSLLWIFRSRPILVFGVFLFYMGLIPQSFLPQPELIADHRFYLSLAGLTILAGWGLAKIAVNDLKKAAIITASILVIFTGLTIWRTVEWSTNQRLWRAAVRVNPNSARAHAMLALEYTHQDKIGAAAKEAKKAQELNTSDCPAHLAIAAVLFNQKDYEGAAKEFRQALELANKNKLDRDLIISCASGLGECYTKLGLGGPASQALQQAMMLDPNDLHLHYLMGVAFYQMGQYKLAVSELQGVLDRDAALKECWDPLCRAKMALNNPDAAYGAAIMAANSDPSTTGKLLLARASIFTGRAKEAEPLLNDVLKSEPKNIEALILLSYAEQKLGHGAAASQARGEAQKIDAAAADKVLPPIPQAQANSSEQAPASRHRRRHH